MLEEIEELRRQALAEIAAAAQLQALEELRVRHLGRRSRLREIMSQLGTLAAEQRPAVGAASGGAQKAIQEALDQRKTSLQEAAEAGTAVDLTLPGHPPLSGHLHPLNSLAEELSAVFQRLGFSVVDGPEIEDEYHNFDALNTPADHPARDLQATFYLDGGGLLRTQTSTVQIRVMETTPPPVRIVAPGRCYRRDAVDATHHFAFHQIEGLYVDRHVSLADLKGTLIEMGRQILDPGTRLRFRPHFFPFTEPSVEYDFSCSLCRGESRSCRVCKGTGWIEIGGAGMVDPAVFTSVGYDPEQYTGFAFGFGIERIAMIRYGIDDIRLFLESDLRFTRQF